MSNGERKYIFDGNSILCDQYADVSKYRYDQAFEDAVVEDENPMARSTRTIDPEKSNTSNNFKSFQQSNRFNDTEKKTDYTLIPEKLINDFKEYSYKRRGNLFKPDTLFKYFLEFRLMQKKGLEIPKQLHPLLEYTNDDVKYSLEVYFHQQMDFINTKNRSTMIGTNVNSQTKFNGGETATNQFNKKFTKDTMRRLYPRQKDIDEMERSKMNCFDVPVYVEKLVIAYKKASGKYSNDVNELFAYWRSLTEEQQQKQDIHWENGEKDLETTLTLYFSDEEIIQRLIAKFKKVNGYACTHARPLHDYWDYQLTHETRYLKGLYKYKKEPFYKLLEKHYNDEIEKKKADEERKEQEEKDKLEQENIQKQKRLREEYQKLQKKYQLLSKPKDRYRTGRVMLRLRQQFKYDNIIKKMIKYEFNDNRPFKFPEEYAVYDKEQEQKILFKNELDKKAITNFKETMQKREEMNSQLITAKIENDKFKEENEKNVFEMQLRQDEALNRFLKKNVISYYKRMRTRLQTGKVDLISKYLNWLYKEMQKRHREATKRRFPKTYYGTLKKAYRYKKMHIYYPNTLKFYFFQLLRRLGKDSNGNYIFAKTDMLSFWGPSLSNDCKVHGKNCPVYCTHNTHNDLIVEQRNKNFNSIFNLTNQELLPDEKVNMWKRQELIKEKEKIFLCLDEARHCTFEPNIIYREKDINEIKSLDPTQLGEKRVSNMKWVNEMGDDLRDKFPIVYKEGIAKKAKIAFMEGRYDDTKRILEKAFELDDVKGYFEPKYAEILKRKRMKNQNEKANDPNQVFDREKEKNKLRIPPDDLKKVKNKKICEEVYEMIKAMEDYRKRKNRTAKQLQEEIDMIEYNMKMESKSIIDSRVVTVDKRMTDDNPKFSYIKDKYFKYFKTLMCPLKEQCPFDLRPRWPSSDIGAKIPFGIQCPYAHQVSELKFEQEIKQKILLRKNLIKELQKDSEPCIDMEWVPTGPIVPCTGCGKTFAERGKKGVGKVGISGGKGLCGFCRYNQKNEIDLKRDKIAADKANEKILKKIKYEGKPQEIDQVYMIKFGMLKKAIVLFNFRRYIDSQEIMDKLMKMVISEQSENDQSFMSLDQKWRSKLEIKEEIPREILDYDITQQVLDHFNIKTPLVNVLLYSEKMKKGNKYSIYNRHTYLAQQIKQFNKLVNKTIDKYTVDIKHIKKQIRDTETWIAKGEKLNSDSEPIGKKLYKKSINKYRKEMCQSMAKTGRCIHSYANCKEAHSSNQINLVNPTQYKNLMTNTITEIENKMKKSKALIPWSYPKRNQYEQSPKYPQRSKSAKKITQGELKKLRINYHEV